MGYNDKNKKYWYVNTLPASYYKTGVLLANKIV